jgi:hypothetical protein
MGVDKKKMDGHKVRPLSIYLRCRDPYTCVLPSIASILQGSEHQHRQYRHFHARSFQDYLPFEQRYHFDHSYNDSCLGRFGWMGLVHMA